MDPCTWIWAKHYSWFMNRDGYVFRNRNVWHRGWKKHTKCYRQYLHREIMGLQRHHKRVAHHKNGTPVDCRFRNLEIVTAKKNAQMAVDVYGERPLWASIHLR